MHKPDLAEPWPFEPAVDPSAFSALGYSEASSGIARTQRSNREGWRTHAQRHRAFILEAAAMTRQQRLAVMFGARKAFDLPLRELAVRFERLVLVDIDAEALAATTAAVIKDTALRRRVELRVVDLSGIASRLAQGIERAIDSATDAEAAQQGLTQLCASYRLARAPTFVAQSERADLLVSGMVLTQLALQPKLLAMELYFRRFGELSPQAAERWSATWNELDLRVQQDHINALLNDAELAVLTSDVVHHSIMPATSPERVRESWLTAGTGNLAERLPRQMYVVRNARWVWRRIAPRPPTHDGVRTEVDALIVRQQAPTHS